MFGERLTKWEKAMEWPLTIAALVFFAAYAVQILVNPDGLPAAIANVLIWLTWVLFLVDYVTRLIITENRLRWFTRHLLDLAIVVLPMLRPLYLMRFLTILAIIQRGAGSILRGRVVIFTIGTTALLVLIAGLAVFDAERNADTFGSFGDAVWWAFVTITTVGYGDFSPATASGRIIAVGLMIGGVALIGVVTATLASWIVERVSVQTEDDDDVQIAALRQEIAELKRLVVDLHERR